MDENRQDEPRRYGGQEDQPTRVGGDQPAPASNIPPPPPPPPAPDEQPTQEREQVTKAAVIDEPEDRRGMGEDEDYQWHTGLKRPSHADSDAVELIDVKKTFGRNTVLNGLNLGIPDGQISMILGPAGTGKPVCIKHMVGLLCPDEADVLVHGESVPNMPDEDLFEMRKKFGVLFQDGALFGSMNLWDN